MATIQRYYEQYHRGVHRCPGAYYEPPRTQDLAFNSRTGASYTDIENRYRLALEDVTTGVRTERE